MVKVANDILLNMNSQRVTLLVLLDLSAAFDTVDHVILLKRWTTDYGIGGKALEWFLSYLSGRYHVFEMRHTRTRFVSITNVFLVRMLSPDVIMSAHFLEKEY